MRYAGVDNQNQEKEPGDIETFRFNNVWRMGVTRFNGGDD
jgi:hypothetical protein